MNRAFGLCTYLACLLTAGFLSCIDEINLETKGGDKKLVIDGQITNQKTAYTVRVSRSGDFSENDFGLATPETGASVRIFSGTNQMTPFNEVSPGVYQTNTEEICGIINESYYVEVITQDGNIYQSKLEKLLPVTPIDNLSYASLAKEEVNNTGNIVTKNYVQIFAATQVPSDLNNVYFKWDLSGVYAFAEPPELITSRVCFISEDTFVNSIAIFDGESIPGQQLLNQEILTREIGFQFAFRYCFHAYQQSLTREAHQYWTNIKSLKEASGSLFDVPPGKVKGNIVNINDPTEEVLGYFYASAVDTSRLFIQGLSLEGSFDQCSREPMPYCTNCISLPNSTFNKPDYWP